MKAVLNARKHERKHSEDRQQKRFQHAFDQLTSRGPQTTMASRPTMAAGRQPDWTRWALGEFPFPHNQDQPFPPLSSQHPSAYMQWQHVRPPHANINPTVLVSTPIKKQVSTRPAGQLNFSASMLADVRDSDDNADEEIESEGQSPSVTKSVVINEHSNTIPHTQ